MSNHATLRQRLVAPDWMGSLYLKYAYLHVPIRQNLHKFLALSCWGKLFFFQALPFGLTPPSWLFSMLMESVLTYLIEGIDILGYLDDLVLWNPCKHGLNMQVQRSVSLLDGLRLTTNLIKSSPFPCLSLTWLGVVWDAALGTWCPTPKLLDKISAAAGDLLEARKGSKTVGRLCGFLALASQINRRANHLADPVTRLGLLARSRNRDEKVRVPSTLLEILVPWTRVKSLVTTDTFAPPTNLAHCWTEVSKAGWGVMDDQGKCWKGRWSQEESSQHINVLELRTIPYVVRLIDQRDLNLVLWSDNMTAISAIQRLGSHSPDCKSWQDSSKRN